MERKNNKEEVDQESFYSNQPKCYKCGKKIDRSDSNKTFVTITKSWFMSGMKRIPEEQIILCDSCGINLINEIKRSKDGD